MNNKILFVLILIGLLIVGLALYQLFTLERLINVYLITYEEKGELKEIVIEAEFCIIQDDGLYLRNAPKKKHYKIRNWETFELIDQVPIQD